MTPEVPLHSCERCTDAVSPGQRSQQENPNESTLSLDQNWQFPQYLAGSAPLLAKAPASTQDNWT